MREPADRLVRTVLLAALFSPLFASLGVAPARAGGSSSPIVVVGDEASLPGFKGPALTFVSSDSLRVLGQVPIGTRAVGLHLAPAAGLAYVVVSGLSPMNDDVRGSSLTESAVPKPAGHAIPQFVVVDLDGRREVGRIALHPGTFVAIALLCGDSVAVVAIQGDKGDSLFVEVIDVATGAHRVAAAIDAKWLTLEAEPGHRRCRVLSGQEKLQGATRVEPARLRLLDGSGAIVAEAAFAAAPWSPGTLASGEEAWFVNDGSDRVSPWSLELRDSVSLQPLATIPLGAGTPAALRVPETGTLVMALPARAQDSSGGGSTRLVRVDHRALAVIDSMPGAGRAMLQVAAPDTLCAANATALRLVRISDGTRLAGVTFPFTSAQAMVTPDRASALVVQADGDDVARLDLRDGRVIGRVTTGSKAGRLGHQLGMLASIVAPIAEVATLGVGVIPLQPGGQPGAVTVSLPADGRTVYALNRHSGDLTTIALDSMRVTGHLPVGSDPLGFVTSRDRQWLVVPHGTSDFRLVNAAVGLAVRDLHANVPSGEHPNWITDREHDRIYVFSTRGFTMIPLGGADARPVEVKLPKSRFMMIP